MFVRPTYVILKVIQFNDENRIDAFIVLTLFD